MLSPRSCPSTYWRTAPMRLPRCLAPVGWIPEKIRICPPVSFAASLTMRPLISPAPAWSRVRSDRTVEACGQVAGTVREDVHDREQRPGEQEEEDQHGQHQGLVQG